MPLYRSRVFVLEPTGDLPPPYVGRGWVASLRGLTVVERASDAAVRAQEIHHLPSILNAKGLSDGRARITFAPELMFAARTRESAQRAAMLTGAAKALIDGELPLEQPYTVVRADGAFEDLSPPDYEEALASSVGTYGYAVAAALAAKISHRRCWVSALTKYWVSLKTCSVRRIEHHPQYGDQFTVERDPFKHALMAQAVVSAYSAVEELNLEVKATQQQPSKIAGTWNPPVLENLLARLSDAGINADKPLVWLRRNPPTRIERKHAPPVGKRPAWAVYHIRDRLVPIADAIHYAGLLRSRVSAHRMHSLTRSLTVHDVINVQHVARRLLLETTGFWDRITLGPEKRVRVQRPSRATRHHAGS